MPIAGPFTAATIGFGKSINVDTNSLHKQKWLDLVTRENVKKKQLISYCGAKCFV